MEKSIIEEINEKKKRKKIKNSIIISFIGLILIILLSFKAGRDYEVNENTKSEENILMAVIYIDIATVSFEFEHYIEWAEDIDNITEYSDVYVQLLNDIEALKATAYLGDQIMYKREVNLPLTNFANSIDRSLFVLGGLEHKNIKVSNNFFDDGVLNESEVRYIRELSEEYKYIHDNMITTVNDKEEIISLNQFASLIERFITKYNSDDSFSTLEIVN